MNIAGFEDGGRGTEAKNKCRWLLEDRKSKETDCSLESLKRMYISASTLILAQ